MDEGNEETPAVITGSGGVRLPGFLAPPAVPAAGDDGQGPQ